MNFRRTTVTIACCASFLVTIPAQAGSGLLGLDHYVKYDDTGIWARSNQTLLFNTMVVGEAVAAVWEGGDTRFGRTMWQSIDATAVGGLAAQAMKYTFSRSRPSQSTDPNQWFQGSGHESFPSGEVTVISAIVTPLVCEYRQDQPAVYALELLPVYDAIARVKVHGHWQSDVIAGFALGTAAGYFMHGRTQTPFVLNVMPHGIYVGLSKKF
jgi:PAP2 superfamily